jgi:hypothetical protein
VIMTALGLFIAFFMALVLISLLIMALGVYVMIKIIGID